MQPLFKVIKYSHFFAVKDIQPTGIGILLNFSVRYVQKTFVREGGKSVLKPTRVFGTRIEGGEFRFHIGQYKDFLWYLGHIGISEDIIQVTEEPLYEAKNIVTTVNPKFEEREYQTNIRNFLTIEEIDDNRSRLVALQTGMGKTFVSMVAASALNKRIMIVVLPKYVQKWISDAKEILQLEPKEILSIQGGKDLKSLLWLSTEQDIGVKVIIVSLTTIQNYYNDFKDHGLDIEAMGYPYKPEEMFKHLGIGTLIFDEVHQHLYGVYRVLLHTHVPKVIALSATLISDDHFIDKMQHIMFPKEIRYNKVPINRYVRVRVYSYGVQDRKTIDKLRTTARGSNTYSHIEYEKSIMKFSPLLNNYLSIVSNILRQNYIDTKEPGDKAIVFAASIAMCNQILHRLKKDYPRLDIRRYVEDDPYENVIEADVRVSTILSAGTAVDIPNLTVAIMTNSVQSPVANLQALGRLRKLKDKEVTFCYIYNYHIKKQTEYHYKKKELFADRAVTIKEFRLDEGL